MSGDTLDVKIGIKCLLVLELSQLFWTRVGVAVIFLLESSFCGFGYEKSDTVRRLRFVLCGNLEGNKR